MTAYLTVFFGAAEEKLWPDWRHMEPPHIAREGRGDSTTDSSVITAYYERLLMLAEQISITGDNGSLYNRILDAAF